MRRPLIVALLLLSFAAPGAEPCRPFAFLNRLFRLFSRPKIAALPDGIDHLRGPETLPPVPKEFIEKIRAKHGSFDPKKLTAKWVLGSWLEDEPPPPGLEREGMLVLEYDGEEVATADLYYRKGAMRFDIDVDADYQGGKLYKLPP